MFYQRPSDVEKWKVPIAKGIKCKCDCGVILPIAECIAVSWSMPIIGDLMHVADSLACEECTARKAAIEGTG